MSDDEFKINEPNNQKKSEKDKLKSKLKKAWAVEMALKTSIAVEKDNLDADNIFNASKRDIHICILADAVPCKNPHCTTCNMMLIHNKEADMMLKCVSHMMSDKYVKEIKKNITESKDTLAEQMFKDIVKVIEEDDEDGA